MSLKSWKREFYRTPADKVPKSKAVVHSLRKWQGLTKENLAKHDLIKREDSLRDARGIYEYYFFIDGESCALCQAFRGAEYKYGGCRPCPLYKALGKPCYDGPGSPYQRFINTGNPEPMISALKKAAKVKL